MSKPTSFYLRNNFYLADAAPAFFSELRDHDEAEIWSDHSGESLEDLVDTGAIITFQQGRAGRLIFPKGTRLQGAFGYQQKMRESVEYMLVRKTGEWPFHDLGALHEDVLHQLAYGCPPHTKIPARLSLSPEPSTTKLRRGWRSVKDAAEVGGGLAKSVLRLHA